MNTEILRKLFQSKFDYTDYCNEIVHKLFGCNDISTRPELLDTTAEGDKSYYIGRHTDTEGRELGFFYTKVAPGSDVCRKRVGLRKLVSPYLKYDVDAAIAVFADERHWRLSYICDMKDGITAAKRFSYILGEAQGQYKTPLERLEKIYNKSGRYVLNDLRDAFSVDALSKEFFDMYHFHYDRIVAELARQGKSGAIYHDYVKKMMGRIVFLHFLQKKKWLNDNLYFLRDMFLFSPHQTDFLDEVLEPLFFGIFNTEQNKREALFKERKWDAELLKQWQTLPYLNGGLFEEDEIDRMNITLPAKLFEVLFQDLASYNFTVDENDPDDAEIGVDPEMLGKIFESLLEDNKSKGAFYTPKEIVRYMCKESLIAHLSSKLPDVANSVVRTYVESHEMQPELEDYRQQLSAALREIKICDPAIGSGAFPMGLLNELWRCREALEPTEHRVVLKKEIIENNIYGVDIEKGAIDIARLRFWLSIVVDSEKPKALPNFDYKFMQGNSLIESYQGCDLSRIAGRLRGGQSKSMQLVLGLDSDLSRKNLQRLLRDYFSVADHQKKASMRHAINEEVKTLIRESLGGTTASLVKLNALDPSANQDFFLWHTWFKDIFAGGGFDIVIGNPPYVNIANIDNETYRNLLKTTFRSTRNKCDLYAYFIERSFQLTSKKGIISFIVPVTWKATDSFSKLREIIFKEHSLQQVVNLDMGVFKAIVQPMIVVFSSELKKDYAIKIYNKEFNFFNKIQSSEIINDTTLSLDTETPFNERCLLQKIERANKKLGDIIKFSRGIKTSDDKRFISRVDTNSEQKKVYRGRNIRPYQIIWDGEYIWYRPDLMKEKVGCLPHSSSFFEVPEKLVMQRIGTQLSVAYDDKQNYFLDTTNVSRYESVNKSYSVKFLCGLLNSKLVNFWYTRKYKLPTIGGYELDSIPIPEILPKQQLFVINLVSQIIETKRNNPSADTSDLEHQIDKLVYDLYGLTEEEIAVIEGK
ncbi:MAG: N-6 DNA methylase [Bacteroidales bacterium]|nr:N-6 DNA methylase [Bacteroidales bacterium]